MDDAHVDDGNDNSMNGEALVAELEAVREEALAAVAEAADEAEGDGGC